MRLGILGGTFDPIHIGHLIIAEEARVSLKLDQVLFVPTGQPWMKADRSISSACHRLNMVGLATEPNPFFKVSDTEIKRPGATYTVDTLRHLRKELEDQDELFLILGMDSLSKLGNWKQSGEILDTCTLVAAPRPGSAEVDLRLLDQIKSGAAGQYRIPESSPRGHQRRRNKKTCRRRACPFVIRLWSRSRSTYTTTVFIRTLEIIP